MRWFNFGILALITLVLQIGVCGRIGIGQQRIMPDLLLLLAVILAFRAPADSALIACWLLGLMKDVFSETAALGSYAFCFGLMAMMVVRMRELLYGLRSVTMIIVTIAMSLWIEQMVFVLCVLKGTADWSEYGGATLTMLFSSLFTGGLAPYGLWLVNKLHRPLGLQRVRSSLR
jgi:rod shape-determining protein MreD